MRQSELFTKTLRENPADEAAINARLLIRAGFIHKLQAGVYTYLPLGLRVLTKIEHIVREEMNAIGPSEMLMPALHPKEMWEKTGRWDSFDALFRLQSKEGSHYALGATHEEVLYSLLTHYIASYNDLPVKVYQIQTKFRDEPRAKSGLLRGREFRMKDLYSFHASDRERDDYYKKVTEAYQRIFERLGLTAVETQATGGTFSDRSLEFQVLSQAGEDTVALCSKCGYAANKELKEGREETCPQCGSGFTEERAIEIGNIFPLKETFARAFGLHFKDEKGKDHVVSAGCYGFGTSRAMGTIVEIHHDEKGIIWPENVAPYQVHLIEIKNQKSKIKNVGDKIYKELTGVGKEVLYDDREAVSAGEKFADADLIGIPTRVVISEATLAQNAAEVKQRNQTNATLVPLKKLR
ncbi:MAG: hypothetical protein HY007_04695 [Candidatus Sungbacteria bacterium]|nr:hypothetical protein [Candidatus Sungbacteria bacterium]